MAFKYPAHDNLRSNTSGFTSLGCVLFLPSLANKGNAQMLHRNKQIKHKELLRIRSWCYKWLCSTQNLGIVVHHSSGLQQNVSFCHQDNLFEKGIIINRVEVGNVGTKEHDGKTNCAVVRIVSEEDQNGVMPQDMGSKPSTYKHISGMSTKLHKPNNSDATNASQNFMIWIKSHCIDFVSATIECHCNPCTSARLTITLTQRTQLICLIQQ